MPFVNANGQRLYYEEAGEGEPLLLVMGLGADHLAWAFQIPAFSERYRTIVFDNRDVGQSSYADSAYGIADMAADTLGLADALGLDSFHLVGVSMGGAISQEVALAAPERVRTLHLCVTWGGSGAFGVERARMLAESAQALSVEQQVDQMMLLCFSERAYENAEFIALFRQTALQNPHPQAPEAFARQAIATGRHETRDRLRSLEMPVHVIGCEHDILVPVWKSRELAELIPGAKLTVLEGTAHGGNWEQAEAFNEAVLSFLAEPGLPQLEPPAGEGAGAAAGSAPS